MTMTLNTSFVNAILEAVGPDKREGLEELLREGLALRVRPGLGRELAEAAAQGTILSIEDLSRELTSRGITIEILTGIMGKHPVYIEEQPPLDCGSTGAAKPTSSLS